MSRRLKRAKAVWTRSAISIQASSRDEGCINRPDTRKHLNLRARISPTPPCIRRGVHTRTFGYRRFEILAAAFNAVLLFVIAIYVFVEAIKRFNAPQEVQSWGMMAVAAIGLVVNLISMRLLTAGKDASFNVKGAYLEVWADMIGSIGVILGALAIKFTGFTWIDPIVAVAIGLWVLPRTWILLRDTTNVLLEGVPGGLKLGEVRTAIAGVPGVAGLHDLHVWSMSNDDVSCTVHVVLKEGADVDATRTAVQAVLLEKYEIEHSTIQTEGSDRQCGDEDHLHR